MKIDLGQTVNTLANVGVIAGIALLVFELSQNRDLMRAQIRNEIATNLSDAVSAVVSDAELAQLIIRANNGEELAAAEQLRLFVQNEVLFRYWESAHYQYRVGLYGEGEFSGHRNAMATTMSVQPNLVDFWCSSRINYSPLFIEYMDALLPQSGCRGE